MIFEVAKAQPRKPSGHACPNGCESMKVISFLTPWIHSEIDIFQYVLTHPLCAWEPVTCISAPRGNQFVMYDVMTMYVSCIGNYILCVYPFCSRTLWQQTILQGEGFDGNQFAKSYFLTTKT